MLTNPTPGRRLAGKLMVVGALAVVLPLTATRAIDYVDIAAPTPPAAPKIPTAAASVAPIAPATPPAPMSAVAPLAPVTPLAPVAPLRADFVPAVAPPAPLQAPVDGTLVLPGGVKLDKGSLAFFDDDRVFFHGQVKRLDQLSRAERSELRAAIAKSRQELDRERARLPKQLAEARRELERIRSGAFKRELLSDAEDLRRDLAEIDAEAAELRANGEDPEKIKAEIRRALREAQAIDIDKEVREALEEANPDKIIAELRNDLAQMERMRARLDQLDRSPN